MTGIASNIADLGLAKQTARGAVAVPTTYRYYLAGGGLDTITDTKDLEETTSTRLRSGLIVASARGEGSPAFIARPRSLPLLLLGAMGAQAVAGVGDPYTHTFTLAAALPYFTAWKNLGALLYEEYVDTVFGQLVLTSTSGNELQAAASLLSIGPKYEGAAEVGGATVDQDAPFVHYDAESLLTFEGSSIACIRSVVLTINNNAAIIPGDNLAGCDIVPGLQTITVECQYLISDLNLYNRLHYGSASPSAGTAPTKNVLELGGGGIDLKWIRQASPERSLDITASRLQVQSMAGYESNPNGDPLVQTVTYRVLQPASGSGLTAVVKNGVAGAYA